MNAMKLPHRRQQAVPRCRPYRALLGRRTIPARPITMIVPSSRAHVPPVRPIM